MGHRIRGIITEQELIRWYGMGCSERYSDTLGTNLLESLRAEFVLEFPVTHDSRIAAFLTDRGYDIAKMSGLWTLASRTEE